MSTGTAIVMPKLGLTMTEGVLSSWRVAPGAKVKTGDILFVVETEKVANEIVAEADGEIEALWLAEGDTAPVGATVATWIPRPNGDRPAYPAAAAAERVLATGVSRAPVGKARGTQGRLVATPFARKQAKARGVDLRNVVGTGPNGRIKAADVAGAIVSKPPSDPISRRQELEPAHG